MEGLLTPTQFAKKHGISTVYVYSFIKNYPASVEKYRGPKDFLKSMKVEVVGGKPFIREA